MFLSKCLIKKGHNNNYEMCLVTTAEIESCTHKNVMKSGEFKILFPIKQDSAKAVFAVPSLQFAGIF